MYKDNVAEEQGCWYMCKGGVGICVKWGHGKT